MGVPKIKSVDNKEILASIQANGKKIEKMIGNFTLTDVDLFQRNYFLKMDDNVIVQVKRKSSRTPNQHIIEIKDINEQYQTFLLVFLILIDSVLEGIQNPTNHPNPI